MDELGLHRASLVGGSSGGCAAIAFAARFPERVDRLLLYGAYAHGPSIAPPSVRGAIAAAVRAHWGFGVARTCRRLRRRGGRRGAAAIRARSARVRAGRDGGGPVGARLPDGRAPAARAGARAYGRGASPRRPRDPLRVWARPRRVHPGGAACERPRGRSSSVGRRLDVRVAGARLVSHGYPRSRPRRGRAAVATRARGPHACRRRAERPRDRRTHRGQPSHRAPSCREHQAQTRERIPRRSGRRSRPARSSALRSPDSAIAGR